MEKKLSAQSIARIHELETVRQAIIPLQIRLGKIDDPERKRQGIARLQQTLQDMSF